MEIDSQDWFGESSQDKRTQKCAKTKTECLWEQRFLPVRRMPEEGAVEQCSRTLTAAPVSTRKHWLEEESCRQIRPPRVLMFRWQRSSFPPSHMGPCFIPKFALVIAKRRWTAGFRGPWHLLTLWPAPGRCPARQTVAVVSLQPQRQWQRSRSPWHHSRCRHVWPSLPQSCCPWPPSGPSLTGEVGSVPERGCHHFWPLTGRIANISFIKADGLVCGSQTWMFEMLKGLMPMCFFLRIGAPMRLWTETTNATAISSTNGQTLVRKQKCGKCRSTPPPPA